MEGVEPSCIYATAYASTMCSSFFSHVCESLNHVSLKRTKQHIIDSGNLNILTQKANMISSMIILHATYSLHTEVG